LLLLTRVGDNYFSNLFLLEFCRSFFFLESSNIFAYGIKTLGMLGVEADAPPLNSEEFDRLGEKTPGVGVGVLGRSLNGV